MEIIGKERREGGMRGRRDVKEDTDGERESEEYGLM